MIHIEDTLKTIKDKLPVLTFLGKLWYQIGTCLEKMAIS
jgi:hypothetical protein